MCILFEGLIGTKYSIKKWSSLQIPLTIQLCFINICYLVISELAGFYLIFVTSHHLIHLILIFIYCRFNSHLKYVITIYFILDLP